MKRTVLITGATRGLGLGMSKAFAREGYSVAMNYAHDDANAEVACAAVQEEGHAVLFKADALSATGVEQLVREVGGRLGSPDTIVINATPSQFQKTIEDYTATDLEAMAAAFMMSPHYLTQAVVPAMKQAGFGRIIHVTSEVFDLGSPMFSAYVAGKGAQVGYMRSSARELAPFGITVNAVAPGWIPVERHEDVPQEERDAYLAAVPAQRWGTPEDIANAVLFFAREASGFVSGQSLAVNGGMTL